MADQPKDSKPHYIWPRYVLGAFILAVVLAVVWMSFAVRKVREQRDPNAFPRRLQTNAAPIADPALAPPRAAERLTEFRDALSGGDALAGRKIFFEKPEASCSRCHKVGGDGGENGPALDGIGSRASREFILESIVFPNAIITTNFESVFLLLKDGSASGTIQRETDSEVVLNTPNGPVTVRKETIKERFPSPSPMPEGISQLLSKKDLQDLVEFIAGLRITPASSDRQATSQDKE